MKIQLISDIHLEFYKPHKPVRITDFLTPSSDYLVICGDLGYPHHLNFRCFIEDVAKLFRKVFIIAGNHEYYQSSRRRSPMYEVKTVIYKLCQRFSNVFFLDNEVYEDEHMILIGTTLWTNIISANIDKKLIQRFINDYSKIYMDSYNLMTPEYTTTLHNECVEFLTTTFNTHPVISGQTGVKKPVIVASHHLPTYKLIHEIYKDNPLNPAFANDLEHLMDKVDYWLCGHTHAHMTADVKTTLIDKNGKTVEHITKCAINPRGYKGDELGKNGFDPAFTIEI